MQGPTDHELFRRVRNGRDRTARNELVERHQGFAYHLAQRYDNKGVEGDDLRQVALLGLVKAVDRFDPDRGVKFATFARPYIEGEIRHHFRDQTWEVHVPRSVKRIATQVRATVDRLSTARGHDPTPAEVAEELEVTVDEVLEAMDAMRTTRTRSLDAPIGSDDDAPTIEPAATDSGYLDVERKMLLDDAIATLDERDRRIVELRFIEEWSQADIAEDIGVSQVHVSRLLRQILADLQERLLTGNRQAM